MAVDIAEALRKDQVAMPAIENEIKEHLTGTDSGPKSLKVFGGLS